jgi:hypothetical protein
MLDLACPQKKYAYLVHVYRGRLEYPDLRRKVIGLAAEHRATTVQHVPFGNDSSSVRNSPSHAALFGR